MKINDIYGDRYLKAADVPPEGVVVKIRAAMLGTISEGDGSNSREKLMLELDGFDRLLVVNQTNAFELAEFLGDETDNWPGRSFVLYRGTTMFRGRQVDAIRVQPFHVGQSPAGSQPHQMQGGQ